MTYSFVHLFVSRTPATKLSNGQNVLCVTYGHVFIRLLCSLAPLLCHRFTYGNLNIDIFDLLVGWLVGWLVLSFVRSLVR